MQVPAKVFHSFSLLLAFVLLLSAGYFTSEHPVLSAVLIFVFALLYLVASIISRVAYFLYGTMLLGAVSYFLSCYAAGAPGISLPLLSVPLVIALLFVGHYLRRHPSVGYEMFPQTVFNAMNITVAVFAGWALANTSATLKETGFLAYLPGLTFLGYSYLYFRHCVHGERALYAYVLALVMVLSAIFLAVAAVSVKFAWILMLVGAGAIAFLGTRFHAKRNLKWSRHFFYSFGGLLLLSLGFSALKANFLLLNLALASILAWIVYLWFVPAVGNIRLATTNERLLSKFFFLASLLLSLPLIPLVFVRPESVDVDLPALLFGLLFARIAWVRRNESGGPRETYSLGASFFLVSGLVGMAGTLPGTPGVYAVAVALVALLALGVLYKKLEGTSSDGLSERLAEWCIAPNLFVWVVPFLLGEPGVALVGGVLATVLSLILRKIIQYPPFIVGIGASISGAIIAATTLFPCPVVPAWVTCVLGAVMSAAVFSREDRLGLKLLQRASRMSWFIFSLASVVFAARIDLGTVLWSVTAVGAVSIFMMGLQTRRHGYGRQFGIAYPEGSVLFSAVVLLSTLTTLALVALGSLPLVQCGLCLIVLAVAYGIAWRMGRGVWCGHSAVLLLALGVIHLIFGFLTPISARLASGALVALVLFLLSWILERRFEGLSKSFITAGHLTSLIFAVLVLSMSWSAVDTRLPISAALFAIIYLFTPGLRKHFGFRLGFVCWASMAVLFLLSTFVNVPYREQIVWFSMASLFWLALGYQLEKGKKSNWPMSMYVGTTAIALFCGLVGLLAPSAGIGVWEVFLAGGISFACLYVITRENIYVYLLTMFLALMAYDWVKISTTHFTQDLLLYLVMGVFVVGLLFSLPRLKTVAIRVGSLPVFSIFNWQGWLLISVCLVGIASVMLSGYAIRITMHPKFCTMCHNMSDYYDSWQHSAHKDVTCLECHYEPGVAGHVEGKMGALVQLTKFATSLQWLGTHHTSAAQPHAIVSNKSCARVGCHSDMPQNKETLLFEGKIRFRHDRHLSEHPRGKELNCVSCHGQAVKGQHISVTPTTCITCHFYGRGDKSVAVGKCTTCHTPPEGTMETAGLSFNHKSYLEGKDKVKCEHCHSQVTVGDASVSRTRCRSCHTEQKGKIEDQAEFHLIHVSKKHFDCLQCHDEVKHGIRPTKEKPLVIENCKSCHGGERHSIQEKIYFGLGQPELDDTPSVMYKAGVDCDGCHTDVEVQHAEDASFTVRKSGTQQCGECHGDESYGEILTIWQEDTKKKLAELEPKLAAMQAAYDKLTSEGKQSEEALTEITKAKKLVESVIVDGSFGAHNSEYVTMMLDKADSYLGKCATVLEKAQE